MGVPFFYRWLVGKYPKVVMEAREEIGDTSLPNPNGLEFDNLYLDMNGIIHPCFHPDDQFLIPQITTYEEVFQSMFDYIDRIFRIVRPRKLVYMAIDGVAPRAKMNQQRSRRYRAAKDAELAEAEEEKLRKQFQAEGIQVLPKQESEVSDPTVITPGTVFMDKLSRALEYYIRLRLNSDPGWRKLKVILSDANVPGEGEHKVMSFIRLQRNLPGYDPNTLHCLYGLDADLIMLALSTHEIHFTILREDVLNQSPAGGDIKLALETSFSGAQYEKLKTRESFASAARKRRQFPKKPYQFLKIWTLRRYLEMDLRIPEAPFEVDLERQIDDFIFMCFFMGNDFLPHIPSVEVHEGAIDLLIHVYKSQFKKNGGYLVDTSKMKSKKAAYIKEKHVQSFIVAVGSFEEKIFEKRQKRFQWGLEKHLRENLKSQSLGNDSEAVTTASGQHSHASGIGPFIDGDGSNVLENTKALMQSLKSSLKEKSDLFNHGSLSDMVKLGAPGWRERYYRKKFSVASPAETECMLKEVVLKYTEGLCWVLQYYFAGVSSWNWFYPFHYAPFASDIKGMNCSSVRFMLGAPFNPFEQLMAVLPPRSAHALPKAFQQLLTDPQSGLKIFYPTDFDVNVDGKRFLWQGIVELPFIEEKALLTETRKLHTELNEEEQRRNSRRLEKIFVSRSHSLGKDIWSLHQSHEAGKAGMDIAIDCNKSGGMNGFLCLSADKAEGCHFTSPVNGMDDIVDDHVVSAFYQNPAYHDHVTKLLENVTIPLEEEITESDIVERKLWHEQEFSSSVSPSCRGGRHYHHRGSPSNAGRNNWRRDSPSPTPTRSDRETWKAAGVGWGGGGGRGAPDGHGVQFHGRGRRTGVGSGRGGGPSSSGGGRGSYLSW